MARRAALQRLRGQPAFVRFGVGTKILAVPLLVCILFGVVLWFLSGYLSRIQSQASLFEALAELGALSERTSAVASQLERPITHPELKELARSWRTKSERMQRVALASGYELNQPTGLETFETKRPVQPDELAAALSQINQQADRVANLADSLTRLSPAEWEYSRVANEFTTTARDAYLAITKAQGLSQSKVSGATRRAKALVLAALLVTVFLALGAGMWISRGISVRIAELSAVAEQLAAGNLARRAPARAQDELGLLALTLNEMASRLELAQAQLKASSVSRRLVGEILKDLSDQMREPTLAMYNTGGRLAEKLTGSLQERLQAFQLQGLGELTLQAEQPAPGELGFTGRDLFQAMSPGPTQADDFARGFLARTAELLTDVECNCEEMACQAVGDSECRFVLYPLDDSGRQALDGLFQE